MHSCSRSSFRTGENLKPAVSLHTSHRSKPSERQSKPYLQTAFQIPGLQVYRRNGRQCCQKRKERLQKSLLSEAHEPGLACHTGTTGILTTVGLSGSYAYGLCRSACHFRPYAQAEVGIRRISHAGIALWDILKQVP